MKQKMMSKPQKYYARILMLVNKDFFRNFPVIFLFHFMQIFMSRLLGWILLCFSLGISFQIFQDFPIFFSSFLKFLSFLHLKKKLCDFKSYSISQFEIQIFCIMFKRFQQREKYQKLSQHLDSKISMKNFNEKCQAFPRFD